MMVESYDAVGRATCQSSNDAEIIQVATQLAECFVQIVGAGNGSERGEARTKKRLASPFMGRAACDRYAFDVGPADLSLVEAEMNCGLRNGIDRSGARKLCFFDGGDNIAIIQERCG